MIPAAIAERPAGAPLSAQPPAPPPPFAPPPPPPRAFLKRHPVPIYFILAFAVSWVCILLVAGGPGGIPATPEAYQRLLPLGIPALLVGPTVAGLLLTGLVSGRAGYRDLLARLLRWRVGVGWYAVGVLTAPLALGAAVFGLSLLSPEFLPSIITADDKTSLLLFGLVGGIIAGIFEELGWTGFAIPNSCGGTGSWPPRSSWASCGERGTSS